MRRFTCDLGVYNGVLDGIAELLQLRHLIDSLHIDQILNDRQVNLALQGIDYKIMELLQVRPEQAVG